VVQINAASFKSLVTSVYELKKFVEKYLLELLVYACLATTRFDP